MESLPKIEEKLKKEEHLPEELFADAGYGSDENYVKSAENGVKLIAPTAHQPKDKVGLNECKFDEKKCIVECPAGKNPSSGSSKTGKDAPFFSTTFASIYAILTMHNIMQMVRHAKIQVKKAHAAVFFQFLDRAFPVFPKIRLPHAA